MVRKLNAVALVVVAVATLLHSSAAQTRHVVGDATGWIIPSGGAATYAAWAANKTFTVGDILVFNFANGQHDVAKVTKSAFDACNKGSTIFRITGSPASVTLNKTGEQHYICTFGTHCSLGQKLSIKVSKASSPAPQRSTSKSTSPVPAPAPQPTTPPPRSVPAPAPAPNKSPVTYTVGDSIGWTVPNGGAAVYQKWASRKKFKVGDILVFNFAKKLHNVAEVTKEKFDSCNATSALAVYDNPPVRLTLNESGEHFFLCAFTGHCSAGQKLAITITGSSTATRPSPAIPPSSPIYPSPSPSSTTNPSFPSPTGAVSPPPQNSGATSPGAAGLIATLLSTAAALLY